MSKKKHIKRRSYITEDGTQIIPIFTDNPNISPGIITPEEMVWSSQHISDNEMNQVLYEQAKAVVSTGKITWPEDDSGLIMWFLHSFINDEMKSSFSLIASEYILNAKKDIIEDAPIPFMMEESLKDSYNMRILAKMLYSAKKGDEYSKNFLLSLYKVYYKREYNNLKRFTKLTYLNLLELFDEDCKEKGYKSAHYSGGSSYKDAIIEKRKHEAGWTDVLGGRTLTPRPEKTSENTEAEVKTVQDIMDAPEEPPMEPVTSRIYVMCSLMNISIDDTCYPQAWDMNNAAQSMLKLHFCDEPAKRRIVTEALEHYRNFSLSSYPELSDPFLYQQNKAYYGMELAEMVTQDTFSMMGRNPRLIYFSRDFNLADEMAYVALLLNIKYPFFEPSLCEMHMLSMIHYLSESLCDLMIERDRELDRALNIYRRVSEGEWNGQPGGNILEEGTTEQHDYKSEKVLKTASQYKIDIKEEIPAEDTIPVENEDIEALKSELSRKNMVLAEMRQKLLRQRALYERAREKELELETILSDRESEHTELTALRNYVYNLQVEKFLDDTVSQENMITAIKDKNVAVLGGIPKWCKKMKEILPGWEFIPVDSPVAADSLIEKADFLYIYTDALKHEQYYRAINIANKCHKMLYYLSTTNIEENIKRFYHDLVKVEK